MGANEKIVIPEIGLQSPLFILTKDQANYTGSPISLWEGHIVCVLF